LDQLGARVCLTDAAKDRHHNVIEAEIARSETLLRLLDSDDSAAWDSGVGASAVQPTGWTPDALLPYLLRDWTSTAELEALSARIGAALSNVFPDPGDKSLVFAACGAGGLLADVSHEFCRVLGFDLALPVLTAARHLLDGESLDLALPQAIHPEGRIVLRRRDRGSASRPIQLAAMDAFDMAFADGSVDCVVTSFLLDLVAEPSRLADEIHRILPTDGVWINYGPSGPLNALWRFDQQEASAFLEAAGFAVIHGAAYRTTYLDVTRDCPAWSVQNHVCYLTVARKSGERTAGPPRRTVPGPDQLADLVPQHFPRAQLIERQSLGAERTLSILLRHEELPGRPKSQELGGDAARALALVDGEKTVGEIAGLLERELPGKSADETVRLFVQFFQQGLLYWKSVGSGGVRSA
jgi:SAM-dependent methyltransferase